MDFAVTVTIHAPAGAVWAVLTDVERWPQWTASVTAAELLDPGPLRPGTRARIRQPGLVPAVYRVEQLTECARFTWTATTVGITTTTGHHLSTHRDATKLRLTITQRGLLARPIGWLLGGKTQRYLRMEADGLKRRCEQPAA